MLNSNTSSKIGGVRPVFTAKSAIHQPASQDKSDNTVVPIDTTKLTDAAGSPTAFMMLLKDNRAPFTIFRVSDTQLRNFHANVRAAHEAIYAAPDPDALINAMRAEAKLPKKTTVSALILYTLGHYDLRRRDDKKMKDAYFWARDKGVQCYLAENNVPAAQTADKIKSLRGVHLTYTAWTSRRKESVGGDKKPPLSFLKSVRQAIRELGEVTEVTIRASVDKAGKLIFVEAVPLSAKKFV